jgi:hypothetical protein
MPVALLLTIAGIGLSLALMSVLTGQTASTRAELYRTNAVNAAQSGLDAAIGGIRSAVRAGQPTSGDVSALPCNTLGGAGVLAGTSTRYAVTGRVSAGSAATYGARVFYLERRPPSGDVAWAETNALPCRPPLAKLAYAMIVATGGDGPDTRRTLTATYSFATTFQNTTLAGGNILLFAKAGAPADLCLAASTPVEGARVVTRACDPADPLQHFSYEANLNLVLTGSNPRLCVDGGWALAADAFVTLRACAGEVAWQLWNSNDVSAFTLIRPDATSMCMVAVVNTGPSDVVVRENVPDKAPCDHRWDSGASFSLGPTVGSGRAGPATGQLVNLAEFSRCIDVTADDPTRGFLVVFPCKQSTVGAVLWNQRWQLPVVAPGETNASGPIWTTVDQAGNEYDGRTYCMRSPGTIAAGAYITMFECVPSPVLTGPLTWTVYADTGAKSSSYRIESDVNIVDDQPLCIVSDVADEWNGGSTEDFNLDIHKLRLANCNSNSLQKWNAAATIRRSAVSDVVER